MKEEDLRAAIIHYIKGMDGRRLRLVLQFILGLIG